MVPFLVSRKVSVSGKAMMRKFIRHNFYLHLVVNMIVFSAIIIAWFGIVGKLA